MLKQCVFQPVPLDQHAHPHLKLPYFAVSYFRSLIYSKPHVCSVLFFSRPRSEGWPHHGRTFSIYPCPLSFWLTLPRRVLSTSWCCPSRPCVAFLAFVHLALFLALCLSPGRDYISWTIVRHCLRGSASTHFSRTPTYGRHRQAERHTDTRR